MAQNDQMGLSLEKKLKEDIEILTETIKKFKVAKFKRDLTDYQEDRVYTWPLKQTRSAVQRRKQRARSVSFNLPSSSEDEYTSDGPNESADFLELPHRPTQKPRGGRGRGGGGRKMLEPTRQSQRVARQMRR